MQVLVGVRREHQAFGVRLIHADRFLQFLNGLIAIFLLRGHRFEGDFLQLAVVADRVDAILRRGHQALHDVAARMGGWPPMIS